MSPTATDAEYTVRMTLSQLAEWAANGGSVETLQKIKELYSLHCEIVILAARADAVIALRNILHTEHGETARRAATKLLTISLDGWHATPWTEAEIETVMPG